VQELKLQDEQNVGLDVQKNKRRRTSVKIESRVNMKKIRKGVRENKRKQLCNVILNPHYPPKHTP